MADHVLVTGGAGYIGSHMCKVLARSGYTPVTFDNLSRGHAWAVKWGPLEVGDLRDRARLAEVMARYRPVAVLHFAAFTYVGESVEHPDLYYGNNLGGLLALLDAMRDAGPECLVFSSSAAVYGNPEHVPITEDHPLHPINPYGKTKAITEEILQECSMAVGLRFASLRYFNAAGADPEGESGEVHDPETHLIPLALLAERGRSHALTVYGDDYPTPDGTCIRDYVHVTDLADAHVKALELLLSGDSVGCLNLGTGRGHSVREVIAACEAVRGRSIPVLVGPRRAGDPPVLLADATQAGVRLGWRPRFPDLSAIVETAWRWHADEQHRKGLSGR